MSLNNPDSRRALRAVIFAVVTLAMIVFAYFFSLRLSDESNLHSVIGYAFVVIIIGTCGYIMENGLRSIRAKGALGEFDINNSDVGDAVDEVADAAVSKAGEIKGGK